MPLRQGRANIYLYHSRSVLPAPFSPGRGIFIRPTDAHKNSPLQPLMSISLSSNVQLPLPFTQFDNRSDGCDQPLTVSRPELRMNDLSNALRNKPSWWTDLKDPALRAQWTEEALQQNIRNGKLSAKEVEQVLSQLENYATMRADPA